MAHPRASRFLAAAYRQRGVIATWAAYCLVFGLFLLRCTQTLDPDFGWHISSGQYILGHGIPQHDIYTYTAANFPWIHHEWLSDVINATIYNLVGFTGLGVFFALLWTLAVYGAVGKVGPRGAVVVLVSALSFASFVAIRDMAWTALLLVVTHRLFARRAHLLPLVFVLWASLHGGFVIGLVYLAWAAITQKAWCKAWVVPVAAAATLINPYGVLLYREITATLFDPTLHESIKEWVRWGFGVWSLLLLALWAIPVAVAVRKRQWRSVAGFDTPLLAATALSLRQFPLFALMALPRLVTFYTGWPKINLGRLKNRRVITRIGYVAALYLLIAGTLTLLAATALYALHDPLRLNAYATVPQRVVASLQQTPCSGNIFNHYDIGGYLIWQYPQQKVYIDGRMPSWQLGSTKYMANYQRILTDDTFRNQQFSTYTIRCAILKTDSPPAKALEKQGWTAEPDTSSGWMLLRAP